MGIRIGAWGSMRAHPRTVARSADGHLTNAFGPLGYGCLRKTRVADPSPALKPTFHTAEVEIMRAGSSWLCPTELDRTRIVDANDRVRTIRLVGAGAIGVALLARRALDRVVDPDPAHALRAQLLERRAAPAHASAHPERVSFTAIVLTLLLIAVGVALTGGPHSPALPWMVLPGAMVAARFRPQVVALGIVLTVLLMLVATLGVAPAATLADPVSVVATLALLAVVISIVLALQAAELHHRDEAILDPLTGLLNRHALRPRFTEISHQARLTRQPVCLLLCDVDTFKEINDRYGHDRGDAVLRDVAYELRKQLRSFELAYRLGGEEFLIVLPGVLQRKGGDRRAAARRDRAGPPHRHPRSRSPSASASPAARTSSTRPSSRPPTRRCTRPSAPGATARCSRGRSPPSSSPERPRRRWWAIRVVAPALLA